MEKRVLIIGSTGMLGHQVLKRLENSDLEVFDIVYRKKRRTNSIICDVTNFSSLSAVIKSIKPVIVINCVGVLVSASEKSPINAIRLNALLPHILEGICTEINAKLIHISTDCVFSGDTGSYVESSVKDARDTYGNTKALGEITSLNHLTIRTSIVGPELKPNGEGLLHWFFTTNKTEIKGFKNVIWGGVTTKELSNAINFAIQNDICGLWNVTNGTEISKLDMLNTFNKYLLGDKQKVITVEDTKYSNKSLKSERTDINYLVPTYSEMFNDMILDIITNKRDYCHYKGVKLRNE